MLDQPGYKTAIDVLSRAVSVFPDYAMAYAALADVYAGSALLSVTRPFEAMFSRNVGLAMVETGSGSGAGVAAPSWPPVTALDILWKAPARLAIPSTAPRN